MEDIMLIRSSFMRRIISQIINKALKKQAPGVEIELKEAQVNWVDKEQMLKEEHIWTFAPVDLKITRNNTLPLQMHESFGEI